jgi:hypothetical protein
VQEYYALEECMGVNDRKWSLCKPQVALLKACNQQTQQAQQQPK